MEAGTKVAYSAVSIPKEGSRHSYMTLEEGTFRWKDLSGREYESLALGE